MNASHDSRISGKRIAYVITRSDAVGGAQMHVSEIAANAMRLGATVAVFVGGSGPYTELLLSRQIPFVSVGYLGRSIDIFDDWKAFKELREKLTEFRPDLVSAHSSKAGVLARLVGRADNHRVIFTAHGWSFTEGIPWINRKCYELVERRVSRYAERIITVSDYDRNLAMARQVSSETKLITVHNGMPDVSSRLWANPDSDQLRLVCVARFDAPKDQKLLISALSKLMSLPWKMDFIGDGPTMAACIDFATKMGLKDRVNFLGQRRDVAKYLARASVFVLPSNWEGLPRSIIEAMRARLPVVASDVGGVSELVKDGRNGYLFEKGNSEDLALRLRRLMDDPQLRRRMGEEGRALYQEKFYFDRMLENTIRVYEQALQ